MRSHDKQYCYDVHQPQAAVKGYAKAEQNVFASMPMIENIRV